MNLQPLEDRVLIEPSEDSEQKTPGGIIIPDSAKEKPRMGVVKSVGTDEALQKIVKAGDKVLYGKYSGDEIEMAGKKYLIVKKEDILAIVK